MILYADIYILINFACDFIALALCACVTSSGIGSVRIAMAALMMALYSFFALVSDINIFFRTILDLLVLVCGIRMSLGKMKPLIFIRSLLIFLASSVVSGGVAGLIMGLPCVRAAVAVLLTPIIYFAWYFTVKMVRRSEKYVNVNIDGRRLSGFSDSGNMLYDSEKGLHIIVANSEKLDVREDAVAGWIKTESVCGTGYMPYYYPEHVEIDRRRVRAAVALNDGKNLKYDCIVPAELT